MSSANFGIGIDPIRLRPDEAFVGKAAAGTINEDGKAVTLRASVLRAVILGKPLLFPTETVPRRLKIPETGLRVRSLSLIGESGDPHEKSAELDLENGCAEDGKSLPPLELRDCVFGRSILLGRARFRGLSLEGSKLVHIYANGIQIEGHLNLASVCSSRMPADQIALGHDHSRLHEAASRRVSFDDSTGEGIVADVLPNQILWRTRSDAQEEGGLCWVELRNCRVSIDVNVYGARLVAPNPFEWDSNHAASINSPHARYALDLRAGQIGGRLKLSADLGETETRRFFALGGVSIIRCVIGGSVCATAATLLAVEGCAFAAERSVVGGHIFFNSVWRHDKWELFEAEGFLDFTNAKVGSSMFMEGARLRRDGYSLGGLVLSQIEVGDACNLCGVSAAERTRPDGRIFESTAGVRLDHARIRGRLEMSGAHLGPDSFGQALYAPELEVFGVANFSIVPPRWALGAFMQVEYEEVKTHTLRFQVFAPVVVVRARFHRRVNFRGADFCLDARPRTTGRAERCLEGDLMHVSGSLWLDTADAGIEPWSIRTSHHDADDGLRFPIRTTIAGSVSLRRIDVAMNLRFTGTIVNASDRDNVAIDLSSSNVHFDLLLNGCAPNLYRFEVDGTIVLEGMHVGHKLSLVGARIDAKPPKNLQLQECAIRAARLKVDSQARLGMPEIERLTGSAEAAEHLKLSVRGYIDLEGGVFLGGLYMHGIRVTQAERLSNDGPSDHSFLSISAPGAATTMLELDKCTLHFSVNLRDFSASHGINASDSVIVKGVFDLWRSTLGFFTIKNFSILDPPTTNQTDRKFLEDVLHLGRARIAGRMTIDAILPGSGSDSRPRFANLRDLEIGSLKDGNGEGWGDALLKLEGFNCRRFDRPNGKAHIKWLKKQYFWGNPAGKLQEGFTPSAYDRVARSLRENGHDEDAKQVLSAKITATRFHKRRQALEPLWWIYHHGFDYGLSSLRALSTFFIVLGIGIGFFLIAGPRGALMDLRITWKYCYFPKSLFFAVQSFIPFIKFAEPLPCVVAPEHTWTEVFAVIYSSAGWLVTSITLLTIPGILRARADS